jgi:hypothetical protein
VPYSVSVCSYTAATDVAAVQVIYAQTDSVFIHFPSATAAEAVGLGQQAAQLVTKQLPPPIELKYERVMCPFMLLHVNRCDYGMSTLHVLVQQPVHVYRGIGVHEQRSLTSFKLCPRQHQTFLLGPVHMPACLLSETSVSSWCVCRYAGCSYETAAAAEAGEGSMLVKGVKAVWRQSAPLLQHTLMVRTAAIGFDMQQASWRGVLHVLNCTCAVCGT